jgi:soluble lytic murein transglycosylase
MTLRIAVVFVLLAGLQGPASSVGDPADPELRGTRSPADPGSDGDAAVVGDATDRAPAARRLAVSDTALDELAAGRFWHAARMLWAEGAAERGPAERLVLARAEAGWENWPSVLELLERETWLPELDDAEGLYLFARSLEHAERWSSAAAAYDAYGALAGEGSAHGTVARARLARSAWRAGERDAALATLTTLSGAPYARSWVAAELTLDAAADGDVEGVRALRLHALEPAAASLLWRAEADALLEAEDAEGAEAVFRTLREEQTGERRAEATVELGLLRVEAGDTAGGRALLDEGFAEADGSARTRAAERLADLGGYDFERTLELARVLDRSGDGARALRGYDRARSLAAAGGIALPEWTRLERARLMATVRDRQDEALEEFRTIRESTQDEAIGARNLEIWARMRGRQNLDAQVATLRRWLVEEYPHSNEAAEVAWSQGSNAEARGALDQALERYAFLAENVATHSLAGQARMRSGQIHLRRANLSAAAEVFEAYLEDFPTGRRWQEAAYWAGRTRLELGDAAAGERHLHHVLTQPVEYYAVMAADLLDVPFAVDVPNGAGPIEPVWLTEGLMRLDVLTEAGLERGADAEIARLRTRAGGERGPRLRLAEALIERGRTIDGINLGWALLEDEGSWDQQILRVAYPFPYRELVRREAAEWGIDPFMMAAIIRQESAFKADIVSHAGAIGLMQVMPPTGAQLARAHGPSSFTDASLTKPEVNLHLGAAFFVDMSRRYDNELPLVLSAYNAGPTRATRWRRYPEASDPLRFTERIPFTETRGYVKSVRRNLGLYRALYGQED